MKTKLTKSSAVVGGQGGSAFLAISGQAEIPVQSSALQSHSSFSTT